MDSNFDSPMSQQARILLCFGYDKSIAFNIAGLTQTGSGLFPEKKTAQASATGLLLCTLKLV